MQIIHASTVPKNDQYRRFPTRNQSKYTIGEAPTKLADANVTWNVQLRKTYLSMLGVSCTETGLFTFFSEPHKRKKSQIFKSRIFVYCRAVLQKKFPRNIFTEM
jgi:hypothetical protein